jgi:hypothetical protein
MAWQACDGIVRAFLSVKSSRDREQNSPRQRPLRYLRMTPALPFA